MRAILINPNGFPENIEVNNLSDLQSRVGGYVQMIPYPPRDDVTIYVNEEGKLTGMIRNPVATDWLKPYLFEGDYIAGPAIVVGFNPATGEDRDLPADFTIEGELSR